MKIRLIRRIDPRKSPMVAAVEYAKANGYTLSREPFGKRGSLIELYRDSERIGHRKSYSGILNLMKKQEPNK